MSNLVRTPVITLVFLLAGCSYGPDGGRVGETGHVQVVQTAELPEPGRTDTVGRLRPYLVGPQDVLIVDVLGIEEMANREIVVDAAGRISIPLAGSVEAAGNSPEELASLIADRLRANYMKDPRVSVNVKEAVSQVVTIDGQVMQPGLYPVIGDMTLTDAVASAKGLGQYAKAEDVVVLRTVNGQRYAGVYNIAAIRRGNYPDPRVYADDLVIVGDSPARRRLEDVMTLLPALSSPLIYLLSSNN
jgi:polysaccharide export outer membrane protein